MLWRASVRDVREGRLSRRRSHLAVVMQLYPRGVPRTAVDEYIRALAPDRALFREFKDHDRRTGDHDGAFEAVDYEARFRLTPDGQGHLERLATLSREKDVYLVCQCLATERCHADLLLLAARAWFGADTALIRRSYPAFEERLRRGDVVG